MELKCIIVLVVLASVIILMNPFNGIEITYDDAGRKRRVALWNPFNGIEIERKDGYSTPVVYRVPNPFNGIEIISGIPSSSNHSPPGESVQWN